MGKDYYIEIGIDKIFIYFRFFLDNYDMEGYVCLL